MTKKMNFPLALITSMALLAYIISPVATVLLQPNVVYAGQPFATINLNTINGQTSPFTSCLTSPITVIGSGTIDPAGLISQYKVEVVWANGDIEDNIPITLLNNTSPYSYEFTAGPHPYATSVSAITIKIYHVQPPGEDGQGDDSETIQVCITPPPPPPVATSTLTLVKEVDNGDGGDALETDWTLSAGGPTPISGVTGDLSITGAVVDPGTYNLSESGGPTGYNPSDWLCVGGTQDDGDTVTIAEGENATCTITNTFGYAGFISGYKWHDLDGNGEWDDGEPGLDGWNIYMNSWDFSTETDENGYYSFSSLPDGEYFVCEESPLPDGWIQTYPDENREDWCFAGQPTGQRVTIEGGNSVEEINFGNWTGEEESLSASIFGFKYDWDSEEGLFGWIITIIGNEIDDFAETNAEGEYRFTNLDPGTYTVCEEQQEGWTQMEPDSEDGCYEVVIDEGEESGSWDFWNQQLPECSDGIDNNDNDGLTDESDPGCYSNGDIINGTYDPDDENESNTGAECGNGYDDDDDGLTDSEDPACHDDGDADNSDSYDPELYPESNDPVDAVPGCTNPEATNYDPEATEDDGSCELPPEDILGCTDSAATNFNSDATVDDGSCEYSGDNGGGDQTPQDTAPPVSAFDDSMDRRIIDTEMVSLSLTGSSSDDMSGVATATMSIFKIGETADFNESAFAKMSCDDNQQFVPIEIVALNLTSVNPLTVTWGHDYNLTNGIFCAEVHATDNAGNTENTATAGPIAYTYTAPTPPPPPPTPPPTPPPSTSGDSGSSGGQGGSINPGVGSPQPAYGAILGATSGQVLGESTACSTEYLRDYIKLGKKNDPEQVAKLQEFLNSYENAGLPVTGFYGPLTASAINVFQVKYWQEVLLPWVSHGLPTEKTPTGYVYKTTKRWINLLACPDLNLVMPELP